MNEQIITTVTDRALCLHCGLPIMDVDRKTDRATFCCIGCETVYQTLEQLGLMDFYKYRGDTSGRRIANDRSSSQYDMLDRKEISENFTTVVEGELRRASFDLAGIHCAGCVWLLEALPKILPAVKNSRVNFGLGKLDLIYDAAQVSLSRIAKEISKLGYEVKFSTGLAKFGLSPSQGKHAELLRLGIAAVCAGNTMMFAVSLWQGIATGIESQYGNLFRWVSLLVSIPAVFYAGFPFYRNAWNALRLGRFHIDLPLSIAMLGAFTASVVNTWAGRANVYFDSVCALIFLLLVGRFLQQRALDRARSHTESAWSLFPAQAYECRATEIHEIPLQLVQVGNLYEVLPGTRVPVDGIIEVGNSDLDTSILTGESQAQPVTVNDLVFAGSLCLDGRIRIRAISTAIDSRVGKILTELKSENSSRPQLLNLTDRASSYFVGGVLLLGIFTFIYWAQFDFWSALDNTVALLVVSCPCALGIAAPLAFTRAAGMASQHGMLLKSEEALERIANIRTVCFDKTGTLTTGAPLVEEFNLIDQSCTATELLAIVSALTNYHLAHPVSRALYDYAKTHSSAKQQIGNFRAIPSAGIEGQDQCGREWRIGSLNWHQQIAGFNAGRQFADLRLQSPIILSRDGELIAYFLLADTIKAEASELVKYLKQQQIELMIMSGDFIPVVKSIAEKIGIAPEFAFGELSPEAKASEIRKLSYAGFIGDGVNDALAMKTAYLGIGLQGGIESNFEVADVYLLNGDLQNVVDLFAAAKRTLRLVKRNILLAACYNTLAAPLAACGYINPIFAAFVMPLASLTVISSTLLSKPFNCAVARGK